MTKTLTLTALLLGLTVASAAPSAAAGAKLYAANCAGCHGAKGQGNSALKAPSLKDSANWKPALFKRALTQLKDDKGVALKPPMMKFPKLKDADISSIQLFLKSATKK